jgi:hypothetical protein
MKVEGKTKEVRAEKKKRQRETVINSWEIDVD